MGKSKKRYCIITDGDGDRWLCPLDFKEQAELAFEVLEEYYQIGIGYDEPEHPEATFELIRIEGETFSFTDPVFEA